MSKFFSTTKKGEIHDLRKELNDVSEEVKVDAVKYVIAAMTEGRDVSSLFTDVLNCMQTTNLELKKLVYLYVMNYAKTKPDLAILAVNTFCKDASDPNPLIRSLAIRTMSCIRVPQMTEYLSQPLAQGLKDEDAYVRKTAAIAVAKLFDISPDAVLHEGFLDTLKELLADKNPMVVSNAVAALSEISQSAGAGRTLFKVDRSILPKLLSALNECTEWGQVFILDSISSYHPANTKEAEAICERVAARFTHSNSAVVVSAVKVVLLCLPAIESADLRSTYMKKLTPPLITLLGKGSQAEVQYVALRNMTLVAQKFPEILRNEVKLFFCRYNDPIYVKLEKLELMIMLVSEKNVDAVLAELKEYATMIDVEFVRKSVRAIGRCAIKLPSAADACVGTLLDLIKMKVNYVVQEAVVVIKDIFRKYPNKYESVISVLCENLETLDEPEAKAAMIWIIGEYADRIDNAAELLDRFLESFSDEDSSVQLQLLTAVVKLFLRRPQETQTLVQAVLNKATQMPDNPDLRDRGYMYWRLLAADPAVAKSVVISDAADMEGRTAIEDTTNRLPAEVLEELLAEMGSLASIFHTPASQFVSRCPKDAKSLGIDAEDEEKEDDHTDAPPASAQQQQQQQKSGGSDLLDLDFLDSAPSAVPGSSTTGSAPSATSSMDLLMDLVGTSSSTPASSTAPSAAPSAPAPSSSGSLMDDLFGGAPVAPVVNELPVLLPGMKGDGMEIRGVVLKEGNGYAMDLEIANVGSAAPISTFAMQYNKNSLGLTPQGAIAIGALGQGQKGRCKVPLVRQPNMVNPAAGGTLQIAVRNNTGKIYYFSSTVPM